MTSRFMAPLFRPLMRTRAAVFMLHRFRMPGAGVEGHDPAAVRRGLELLRRERYDFVSLAALYEDLLHGRAHRRPTVAFTIDDGYADQARVGAPIFAEFDCPVTTFVTSGFLDRALWFWWDRIEHVFRTTTRRTIDVPLGDTMLSYALGDARDAALADFVERCKEVPDAVKHAAIDALAVAAEVELPDAAPERYAPMTWDELRAAERGGMTFGPHTVTHPVLSRTPDGQSRHELTESWRRLREEAANPVPVFCYPNGRRSDFGDREIETMRELGFVGAVVGETGYAERLDTGDGTDPYRVRRFAFTGDDHELLQVVSGVEVVNQLLRGG
ncbi:MAG TPA: polysaccharide deacetylase family protein [Gemmatimonadaceae bacterium]|nr:polysaccharide deacetylase family protein [Gemmatimonadaceae bacterium]